MVLAAAVTKLDELLGEMLRTVQATLQQALLNKARSI
jgi:hypothetical protein